MVDIDKWVTWPYNLIWVLPAWLIIAAIVGLLFGMLMEAGDYERRENDHA